MGRRHKFLRLRRRGTRGQQCLGRLQSLTRDGYLRNVPGLRLPGPGRSLCMGTGVRKQSLCLGRRCTFRLMWLGDASLHLCHGIHLGLCSKAAAHGMVRTVRALHHPLQALLHGEKRLPAGRADQACCGAGIHRAQKT